MALGFVFPGQGSQAVGMLAEWIDTSAPVRLCFEEAEEALGKPLREIIANGPEADLNRTEITQPVLLTASVALWRLWSQEVGVRPGLLAGHSLGEYSALVCADALDFSDAVRLVETRGRCMQEAVPAGEGAMAAILGLDDDDVARCCAAVDGVVAPANFNSPGQVVIAGATKAVDAAIANCENAGAKRAMKLPVSVPSHCELMAQAAAKFSAALDAVTIRVPEIPLIQNVDAGTSNDADEIRARLVAQLSRPVLWTQSVARMTEEGVSVLVECGPGKVLAGLIRRIDRSVKVFGIDTPDAFAAAVEGIRS